MTKPQSNKKPPLTLKSLNEKIDLVAKAAGNSDMDIRTSLFEELGKFVKESDKRLNDAITKIEDIVKGSPIPPPANIYERTIKKVDELLDDKIRKLEKEQEDIRQKLNMLIESGIHSRIDGNIKKLEELDQKFYTLNESINSISKYLTARESNKSSSSNSDGRNIRVGDVWLTTGGFYAYITGEFNHQDSKCPPPCKFKGILFEFSHKALIWSPIKHFKMIQSDAAWDDVGRYSADRQYDDWYLLDKRVFRTVSEYDSCGEPIKDNKTYPKQL
jgi:hypothetical protein